MFVKPRDEDHANYKVELVRNLRVPVDTFECNCNAKSHVCLQKKSGSLFGLTVHGLDVVEWSASLSEEQQLELLVAAVPGLKPEVARAFGADARPSYINTMCKERGNMVPLTCPMLLCSDNTVVH